MFRRHRVATLAAIAATAALALAGCSSPGADGSSTPASSDSSGSFPVTIQSALGDVTIDSAPQRIVTLGWSSNDALLSMGIAPVGMEKQAYGGDDDGVLPWTKDALDAMGAAEPTMITSSDEPAYEEIQALKPDLILAVYSGITQDQYDLLTQIAPTVAYSDAPWSTPWRSEKPPPAGIPQRSAHAAKGPASSDALSNAGKASRLRGRRFFLLFI